jgi:hypothetical protein
VKNNVFSPEKKDRKKIIRATLQGITLIALFVVIIRALFIFNEYKPYDSNIENTVEISNSQDTGFIAVSYFGVDRTGDSKLISTELLEKHLKALKDNGYVTITQQDILDYYNKGKLLPKKALFLLFEDGRRDTAIFAEKILEKYNYKGTIQSYADKFAKRDNKFLSPKDLLELVDTTYWELGTNGYRLEYINVFDKEENYLGQLNSVEFSNLASTMYRDYNHYLMDYIRDENGIPMESYEEMKSRLDYDYEKLSEIYNKELGEVPQLYTLMHSNTGQFGTNDRASGVNGKWIEELFKMNFNREGFSLNLSNSSIYDLTRIQPQSYWTTNHLLMRIWDDTKENVDFVVGDIKKAENFETIKGQAEFKDDYIYLTSLPEESGILKLKNSEDYKDVKLSTWLEGNIVGSQSIYLRANEDRNNNIKVQLVNNIINVVESIKGNEKILFTLDLNEEEVDVIDINKIGNRFIEVNLGNNKLSLKLDNEMIVDKLEVNLNESGSIYLESLWGEYGYSQRNIADDVYDGIFHKLKITNMKDEILFDSTLKGLEAAEHNIKGTWNKIINWFIQNL